MLKLGSQGEDVKTLQEALSKIGHSSIKVDGDFGEKTEDAVIAFQEEQGLYADGVVGAHTQHAINNALSNLADEQTGLDSVSRSHTTPNAFVRVPADKYRDGYDRFFLRNDAAEAYQRVRASILHKGGIITSSGAKRSLNANVSPSRSATSFHYTGRALDLQVGSGMENTRRDPYVITPDGDRYWRVYTRAEGGESMSLDAVTYGSRNRTRSVNGNFIDLTALFEVNGFKRIRARKSFFTGGTWLGAEWWHFQWEEGLIKGETTFGSELLRVYPESTLTGTPPWRSKDNIFGVNWF